MSYKMWFEKHASKHDELIKKLRSHGMSNEELIQYFLYENISLKEPNFCPLYALKQKCHDMENLNCFLCACPRFRFCDKGLHVRSNGVLVKSQCAIHSRFASEFVHENISHLDCSKCTIPHEKAFIKKHINKSWKETMSECSCEN
jgi:hypothetical protein